MKRKAVKLKSGEILIGELLDFNDSFVKNHPITIFNKVEENAVFLKREKHITYLSKDEIVSIRNANAWEKEVQK